MCMRSSFQNGRSSLLPLLAATTALWVCWPCALPARPPVLGPLGLLPRGLCFLPGHQSAQLPEAPAVGHPEHTQSNRRRARRREQEKSRYHGGTSILGVSASAGLFPLLLGILRPKLHWSTSKVLSNRWVLCCQNFSLDWCKQPDVGLPKPDVVVFLQLQLAEAAARGEFGRERYENGTFQERALQRFHQLMGDPSLNWKVRSHTVACRTANWEPQGRGLGLLPSGGAGAGPAVPARLPALLLLCQQLCTSVRSAECGNRVPCQ